jgi:hypothetical protein
MSSKKENGTRKSSGSGSASSSGSNSSSSGSNSKRASTAVIAKSVRKAPAKKGTTNSKNVPLLASANATSKTKKRTKKPKETSAERLKRLTTELKEKETARKVKLSESKAKRNAEKAAKKAEAKKAAANTGEEEPTESAKATGKEAHEARIAEAKDRNTKIKADYETNKTTIDDAFKQLRKGNSSILKTGAALSELAKLQSHGFELALLDHLHLTKHINNAKTDSIIEKLFIKAKTLPFCDACALEKYMLSI